MGELMQKHGDKQKNSREKAKKEVEQRSIAGVGAREPADGSRECYQHYCDQPAKIYIDIKSADTADPITWHSIAPLEKTRKAANKQEEMP